MAALAGPGRPSLWMQNQQGGGQNPRLPAGGTHEQSPPKLEPQGHSVPRGLLPKPHFWWNSCVGLRGTFQIHHLLPHHVRQWAVEESRAEGFAPGYRLSRWSSRCSELKSTTAGLPKSILTQIYIFIRMLVNNELTIVTDLYSVFQMWKSVTITCLNEGHRQHHVFLNIFNFSNLTLEYCSHWVALPQQWNVPEHSWLWKNKVLLRVCGFRSVIPGTQ